MECTSTLLPPWCILFILHRDGEMAIWKWANDISSSTTPATTAVFAHQLFCQLKAEALDVGKGTRGTVVLHENESIGYSYIEQEGEDVFIKLPTLCSAAIIATELVSMIHTPHVFIVADDGLGTGDRYPRPILLPSEDASHSIWLAVGRHDHDHLTVHPGTC